MALTNATLPAGVNAIASVPPATFTDSSLTVAVPLAGAYAPSVSGTPCTDTLNLASAARSPDWYRKGKKWRRTKWRPGFLIANVYVDGAGKMRAYRYSS